MADDPGMLTAAEVGAVRFGRPRWGSRGYNEYEVDTFLELVAMRLEEPYSLTAEDIRTMVFSAPPIGKRGYHKGEVEAFLARAAATVAARERLGR